MRGNSEEQSLSVAASQHPDFTEVYDVLLERLFLKKKNATLPSELDVSVAQVQKATWLASAIALSPLEELKNLANSFAALLYLHDPRNELYRQACYILQSRTGNLLSSRHVPKIFSDGHYQTSFGAMLDIELSTRRGLLTQRFNDDSDAVFTEFQKELWRTIRSGKNTAISAPTSAGKSFIIQRYILETLLEKPRLAFYVVPTKALINQVSGEFKAALGERGHVYTTYRDIEISNESVIFVLTPERCIKVMQDIGAEKPDIVFFDEIHNLEDGSRGLVFENALYRMVSRWKGTQFIFAGPFINDITSSIEKIADIEVVDATTVATPVFQIKAAITFKPNSKSAEYRIYSLTGSILSGELGLKKAIYSKVKNSPGDAVAAFLDNLGGEDSCIVFAPRKNSAEKWAIKIAPLVGMSNPAIVDGADSRVKDLLEFLADEIHPDYSLIRALRMGVGFHHAGLPDIARIEIEDLYSSNVIKHLVCTSTLVQGVNLPADKLIVINPSNDKTPLTNFEFMNLIGRAGRISTNLYGEVYCLDVVDEEWGVDRITDATPKTIRPSTISSLEERTETILDLIDKERSDIVLTDNGQKAYSAIAYLRQLHAADRPHFERLLESSNLSSALKKVLRKRLEPVTASLEIPDWLLQRNPYVDPLLQDKFYQAVRDGFVDEWVTNKYPFTRQSDESSGGEDFGSKSFYRQFESIARRLNQYFDIEYELNSGRWGKSIAIGSLVRTAYQWMSGKSHRYFIEEMISDAEFDSGGGSDQDKIDRAARHVTGHISRDVTFILVKYFSIWSDVVSSFMTEDEKEEHSYSLGLPGMIELGSFDPKVLELMSLGINRSIALKLRSYMRGDVGDVEEWLRTLNLSKMPRLYSRYLRRTGLVGPNLAA
ncbi:hypothetical protein B6S59_01175 [Pseudomonas sp. A46]|nr:DEAD/DEAH box helicase [Pseudomonas sp. A46]OWJ98218.1 hypothetical protein B6S59_01175 [Pseudomonas sp. A46]